MGWNDRYSPEEYDPDSPDSMLDLARRAFKDKVNSVYPVNPSMPVGTCWGCGRENEQLYPKGLCAICKSIDVM